MEKEKLTFKHIFIPFTVLGLPPLTVFFVLVYVGVWNYLNLIQQPNWIFDVVSSSSGVSVFSVLIIGMMIAFAILLFYPSIVTVLLIPQIEKDLSFSKKRLRLAMISLPIINISLLGLSIYFETGLNHYWLFLITALITFFFINDLKSLKNFQRLFNRSFYRFESIKTWIGKVVVQAIALLFLFLISWLIAVPFELIFKFWVLPKEGSFIVFSFVFLFPVLGYLPAWSYLFLKESEKHASKAILASSLITCIVLAIFLLSFQNKFFSKVLERTNVYSLAEHDVQLLNPTIYTEELILAGIKMVNDTHFIAYPRYRLGSYRLFCKDPFDPSSEKDIETAKESLARCVQIKPTDLGLVRPL